MYGPDILFAPIMDTKVTDRPVYLPEGKWVRVGGGEKVTLEGGQTVTCHAELAEFIAFVREGAEVLKIF
jgi:alpha-D-xyloside xylohydrolase